MDAATWTRVCQLFDRLADQPPSLREEALTAACPDPEDQVRREVERMLAADRTQAFLDRPAARIPILELLEDETCAPGSRIGGFELLEMLAEGGMSTVYLARQLDPPRNVALKMRRGDPFSAVGLRRFQYEAEVLAAMQHPGIAQLYEAGTHWRRVGGQWTEQPFVAIECVEGAQDIVSYARSEALTVEQRLTLFRQVCEAVSYAHHRGILHRDLKAENILVDATGRPRVIDFGIAQSLDLDSSQERLTESGQIVGSLTSMSPEQVSGHDEPVDVRSDVYSLGTVLYELLEDCSARDLSDLSLTQAWQAIREQDLRLPTKAPKPLRWVLLKALHREPAGRYGSVNELARDLERFVCHEPVLAGAPSRLYTWSTFLRRHRSLVLATGAVLAALTWGLIRSEFARMRAEQAEQEALSESRRVGAAHDFMLEMFENAGGPDATVVSLLDSGRARLDTLFSGSPGLRSEVAAMLGKTYLNLDQLEPGQELLESALAYQTQHGTQGGGDWLQVHADVTALYLRQQRFTEGLALCNMLLNLQEQGHELSDDMLASFLGRKGAMLQSLGRIDGALSSYGEALELLRASGRDHGRHYLTLLGAYSDVLVAKGQAEEALALQLEILEGRQSLPGPPDDNLANTQIAVGLVYQSLGNHREAVPHLEDGLALLRAVMGPQHFTCAEPLSNLAASRMMLGLFDEARVGFAECIAMAEHYEGTPIGLGAVRSSAFKALVNIGFLDQHLGQVEQAVAGFEAALQDYPEFEASANYRAVQRVLVQHFLQEQDIEAALSMARWSCERLELEPNPAVRLECLALLVQAAEGAQDTAGARDLLREEANRLKKAGVQSEALESLLSRIEAP